MAVESDVTRRTQAARVTRYRYDRNAPLYDLLESGMERARYTGWRELLWKKVTAGLVLEVGIGTGHNLPHHPPGSRICGVDLSGRMLAKAMSRRGGSRAAHVSFFQMDAQELAFAPDSFDTVVATFVFCSVPDPVRGLQEARRVLATGGRLLLIEHILVRLTGANINRDTVENVRRAGLSIDRVTELGAGGIYVLIEASRPPAPDREPGGEAR